mgnify:CR=1 FL=1
MTLKNVWTAVFAADQSVRFVDPLVMARQPAASAAAGISMLSSTCGRLFTTLIVQRGTELAFVPALFGSVPQRYSCQFKKPSPSLSTNMSVSYVEGVAVGNFSAIHVYGTATGVVVVDNDVSGVQLTSYSQRPHQADLPPDE